MPTEAYPWRGPHRESARSNAFGSIPTQPFLNPYTEKGRHRLLSSLCIGALGIAVLLIAASAALALIRTRLASDAEGRLITTLEAMPQDALIVLLGCPTLNRDGHPNRYFTARVAAAAAAYHAINARIPNASPLLLCSGLDARGEVRAFHDALIGANVPEQAIQLDGDAARTIDSIDYVAALNTPRTIYFVSQRFHLPRVLFLSRTRRLSAWGLIAEGGLSRRSAKLREFLAGGRAIMDILFVSRPGAR